MQEVLGYNADVICLQEVDESAFRVCVQPHMEAAGALSLLSIIFYMLCRERAAYVHTPRALDSQ